MIFTRNISALSLAFIFFSSCADRIKTDLVAFKELDESLVNSNHAVHVATEIAAKSLEAKLTDPATHEEAKNWFPKVQFIKKLSKDTYDYIESLRNELKREAGLKTEKGRESFREGDKNAVFRLFDKKKKGEDLFEKLMKYKNEAMAIDSGMTYVFKGRLPIAKFLLDSIKNGSNNFSKTFFDDIPVAGALAMLSKFQNDIKNTENKIIIFCDAQVPYQSMHHDWHLLVPFAASNSSYVKSGEKIEITAAVGSFSRAALPEIIINRNVIPIGEDGAAHYTFKTSEKPGNYSIPVTINFVNREGVKQTWIKKIEYTVAQ